MISHHNQQPYDPHHPDKCRGNHPGLFVTHGNAWHRSSFFVVPLAIPAREHHATEDRGRKHRRKYDGCDVPGNQSPGSRGQDKKPLALLGKRCPIAALMVNPNRGVQDREPAENQENDSEEAKENLVCLVVNGHLAFLGTLPKGQFPAPCPWLLFSITASSAASSCVSTSISL